MYLSKKQREEVRMMFGGKCAYCGCDLTGKWHADHVEPVSRNGYWRRGKWTTTHELLHPEHDKFDNLFPACVKCNILKSKGNVENFRSVLTYFVHSIPKISTYSHIHHLIRFGKLHIDTDPVVFWFEKFSAKEFPDGR